MPQHLTRHMVEPTLPGVVVTALLAQVETAYVRSGLVASGTKRAWWRRVPGAGHADHVTPPYAKIIAVVPGKDLERSTRSGYVGRHRVELRHAAAHPDEALRCYNATIEHVIGRPLPVDGYSVQIEYADGGGGYAEAFSEEDESEDLYYLIQPLDLVIQPTTN